MPSPITVNTFAASELVMKYHEPYVTQGLNQKLAIVTPPGIYRGFKIGTSATNLNVTIKADPESLDHVANYVTGSGYSLTVRRSTGDFPLDLTAAAGTTVLLCIYSTYSLGFTTTSQIQAFTTAEYQASAYGPTGSNELIVLGTIVVPASGLIPLSNISHDPRTSAWANVANEQVAWAPLLRNNSFEWGPTGQTYAFQSAFWEADATPSGGNLYHWSLSNADANSGAQCMQLVRYGANGAITAQFGQRVNIPVFPGSASTGAYPGQLLKVNVSVRQLQAMDTGSLSLYVEWGDVNGQGNTIVPNTVVSVLKTGTDSVWRQVTKVLTVPAAAHSVKRVGIAAAGATISVGGLVAGPVMRFDDLQCWLETNSPFGTGIPADRQTSYSTAYPLVLEDPTSALNAIAAAVHFDASSPNATEGGVTIERRDQNAASVPPAIIALGRILVGSGLLNNGTAPGALSPRLQIQGDATTLSSATKTLILESDISGSAPSQRIYCTGAGNLEFTLNARYDGTNWNKDVSGQGAARVTFGHEFLKVEHQIDSFGGTWAESSWSTSPLLLNLESGNTLSITGIDTNSTAITGNGTGTNAGVSATGGSTSGTGVTAVGGAPNGVGLIATGTGTGDGIQANASGSGARGLIATSTAGIGVYASGSPGLWGYGSTGSGAGVNGQGGDTSGPGVTGTGGSGGASTAIGVSGHGTGAGVGVYGNGGNTNAAGVQGLGHGTAPGVLGTGGTSSGPGLSGTGGATNGEGVLGQGVGTGAGVSGVGGPTGSGGNGLPMSGNTSAGITGVGGSGGGDGGDFTGILSGNGVTAVGGTASGVGVQGFAGAGSNASGGDFNGDSTGAGMSATGGRAGGPGIWVFGGQTSGSAPGVKSTGGHPDGVGVEAHGFGAGDAITGTAPGGGCGITATSVDGQGGNFFSTNGVGLEVATSGATAACLYVIPSATALGINISAGGTGSPVRLGSYAGFPTTHIGESDLQYNSFLNTLNIYDGSYWTSNMTAAGLTLNPGTPVGHWADDGAGGALAYGRDSTGRVQLRGTVKTATNTDVNAANTNIILQMPSGFRPSAVKRWTVTFPNAYPLGPGLVSSSYTCTWFLYMDTSGNLMVEAYALNNGNTLPGTVLIPLNVVNYLTW